MPISKAKNAERMRAKRAAVRALLLPLTSSEVIAELRREVAALRLHVAVLVAGMVPPVTASERAQADERHIRALGDMIRELNRSHNQQIDRERAEIRRLYEQHEVELVAVRRRLTMLEAAAVLDDIPYTLSKDGYAVFGEAQE